MWKEGIQGGESRHLAEKGANANLRFSSQEVLSVSQAESVPALRCLSRALVQEDGEATHTAPAQGLSQQDWLAP